MIKDRIEAGKLLGKRISTLDIKEPIVLAIPRGGMIVGHEVAKVLNCKLDVVISKKITPPENPEYAIGAITYDGTIYEGEYWNKFTNYPNFDEELDRKKIEVKRRLEEYRGTADYNLKEKTIILVDDGIATGSTVFAILNWLNKQNVEKILLAIPVIPVSTHADIERKVSQIIALEIPFEFSAVGQFYKEFDQVSDQEVKKIIKCYRN